MRVTYTSINGSGVTKAFSLTQSDLGKLIADHFGFDPETIDMSGIQVLGDEFHVSGTLKMDDTNYEEGHLRSTR